jgi:hypothetical protein
LSRWEERVIEWRAFLITDPSARLRFVRSMSGYPPKRRLFRIHSGFLLAAVLIWPPATAPDFGVPRPARVLSAPVDGARLPPVWLVETQPGFETYSNGLRIETRFETDGPARKYMIYDGSSAGREAVEIGSQPVGIVFHSSESLQLDFEPKQNRALQRIGENLLSYVRSRRCYNYVIDRFGRVWRIVPEAAIANHAGWSVWGSDGRLWVNLNRSFLGISFEARTGGTTGELATPAQVHSARILLEMLRARYNIRPENCVTHAQVSVTPHLHSLGNHVDWITGFPFEQLGLPVNYDIPPPAIAGFGIGFSEGYASAAAEPLRAALRRAEEELRREADWRGMPPTEWRARLQRQYEMGRTTLQNKSAAQENDDDER